MKFNKTINKKEKASTPLVKKTKQLFKKELPLEANYRTLIGKCPFHNGKGSIILHPHWNTYYCNGCKKKGDIKSLLIDIWNLKKESIYGSQQIG